MRRASGLGLIFVGIWSIAYFISPHAFGATAKTSFSFAVLAAMTTTGIGLLFSERGPRP